MDLSNWRGPGPGVRARPGFGLADLIRQARTDIEHLEQAVEEGDTVLIRRGADRLAQTAREYGMVDAVHFAYGVKRAASELCLASTLEQLANLKACFEEMERRVF